MTYRDLIKQIKTEQKQPGIAYISYATKPDNTEFLISNFLPSCHGITDNQIFKLINSGLVIADWDIFIIVK